MTIKGMARTGTKLKGNIEKSPIFPLNVQKLMKAAQRIKPTRIPKKILSRRGIVNDVFASAFRISYSRKPKKVIVRPINPA